MELPFSWACCTSLNMHNYYEALSLLLIFAWFQCNFLVLMPALHGQMSIGLNLVKCIFAVLQMVSKRITASVFPVFYPKVFTQQCIIQNTSCCLLEVPVVKITIFPQVCDFFLQKS